MSLPSAKKLLMGGALKLRPRDVFATALYTGNGGTQTITNGLDLAGKGGLVWGKRRSEEANHILTDTLRGGARYSISNDGGAEISPAPQNILSFNADGFTVGNDLGLNKNAQTVAAWSFRRAKKFFDIVTYTGDGVAGRRIPHRLGSVPGMIIVKGRSNTATGAWPVWHRSRGGDNVLLLNRTDAEFNTPTYWASGSHDDSTFQVGTDAWVNQGGQTYVAYLFAHNPDLIDCGSYNGAGGGSARDVVCGKGWKPQFLLVKETSLSGSNGGNWMMFDDARSTNSVLRVNVTSSEVNIPGITFQQTGFRVSGSPSNINDNFNLGGNPYIYMAIRSPT